MTCQILRDHGQDAESFVITQEAIPSVCNCKHHGARLAI
jgi:hypothetical protein